MVGVLLAGITVNLLIVNHMDKRRRHEVRETNKRLDEAAERAAEVARLLASYQVRLEFSTETVADKLVSSDSLVAQRLRDSTPASVVVVNQKGEEKMTEQTPEQQSEETTFGDPNDGPAVSDPTLGESGPAEPLPESDADREDANTDDDEGDVTDTAPDEAVETEQVEEVAVVQPEEQ